uniref:Uncharacterized protein n=1 Tax=Acrobeloides nanus TaxID=290746 RepID=A0A914C8F5_9BILA
MNQKSGSVSHGPREPSIKEDEDEHTESSDGQTGSSNATLPAIGGHHPGININHISNRTSDNMTEATISIPQPSLSDRSTTPIANENM